MEKVTFSTDIYSVGVILFRCLIGTTPPPSFYDSVSEYIKADKACIKKPSDNIYSPPAFLLKFILSDGMCYILTHLLHPNLRMRYSSLYKVRKVLLELQHSLRAVPKLLRNVIGHPKVMDMDMDIIDSGMEELSPKKRRNSDKSDERGV